MEKNTSKVVAFCLLLLHGRVNKIQHMSLLVLIVYGVLSAQVGRWAREVDDKAEEMEENSERCQGGGGRHVP